MIATASLLIGAASFGFATESSSKASDLSKTYRVRATVKKIIREEKKITLDHEKVPGYMNAMVMTFPVADPAIFDQIQVGSKGLFTLRVEKGFPTVTKVKMFSAKNQYYCPMHPNETSDKPGKCPECGMDLVKRK